jgi:hypothetical protein
MFNIKYNQYINIWIFDLIYLLFCYLNNYINGYSLQPNRGSIVS